MEGVERDRRPSPEISDTCFLPHPLAAVSDPALPGFGKCQLEYQGGAVRSGGGREGTPFSQLLAVVRDAAVSG